MRGRRVNLQKKLDLSQAQIVDKATTSDRECNEFIDKAVNKEHTSFTKESMASIKSVLKDFDGTYNNMLTETLFGLLEHVVKKEKKQIITRLSGKMFRQLLNSSESS